MSQEAEVNETTEAPEPKPVALFADRQLQHQVATVEAPAFPNLPDLIEHQGKFYMGGTIGYGPTTPAYYEVTPFRPECDEEHLPE